MAARADLGGTNETLASYPHPDVREVDGTISWLHRDTVGSIRFFTNASGERSEMRGYSPYGVITSDTKWGTPANAREDKGYIGERYDEEAQLQYLNARYYDPTLGRFIQPDWLDPLEPGVGTNRYAYSFNDPINLADPGGNHLYTPDYDMSDEEADKMNSAIADNAQAMADAIRSSNSIDDMISEFLGVDDLQERIAEHHRSRVGLTRDERIAKDIEEFGRAAVEAVLGTALSRVVLKPIQTMAPRRRAPKAEVDTETHAPGPRQPGRSPSEPLTKRQTQYLAGWLGLRKTGRRPKGGLTTEETYELPHRRFPDAPKGTLFQRDRTTHKGGAFKGFNPKTGQKIGTYNEFLERIGD